jgi:tripartite-type tricarboxylate transporter receptor subunit TctC
MRHNPSRRALLAACGGGAAMAMVERAFGFPLRPIRIIVPQAAGGVNDVAARLVAGHIATLGQPCLVENRTGAGGTIAATAVTRAAPDGHTLLLGNTGTHATNPATVLNLPYDPLVDFEMVANIGSSPFIVVVRADIPADGLPGFLAWARARREPVVYGSAGTGASVHLATELFRARTGIAMTHVPYRGTAPALTDLAAGHIDLAFGSISSVMPLVQTGRARTIGLTSLAPSLLAPGIPTFSESGLPGFEATTWSALFAPKSTPEPVLEALNAAVNAGISSDAGRAAFRRVGLEPTPGTREDLLRYVRAEIATWAEAARQAGITPGALEGN